MLTKSDVCVTSATSGKIWKLWSALSNGPLHHSLRRQTQMARIQPQTGKLVLAASADCSGSAMNVNMQSPFLFANATP